VVRERPRGGGKTKESAEEKEPHPPGDARGPSTCDLSVFFLSGGGRVSKRGGSWEGVGERQAHAKSPRARSDLEPPIEKRDPEKPGEGGE